MSYFEIDNQTLDFIVDKNSYKHGKFMGGNHIPILSLDAIYTHKPDYILILAWNFADEIMTEHQLYKQTGGHFIIPIPKLEIL